MLEYYTGVPGSGKTYRAVAHAYDCFIDEKSKLYGKYRYFYTNINEFKFDSFNTDKEDIAFPLHIDRLLISLHELHLLYLNKAPDAILLARAKELDLADALFIIDEAHNYFDNKNDVLVWWLSYHRHLHQDIILITQNLSLIYKKYLSFAEFFYNAVASSLRLRGSVFTYHQFTKWQLYKNSHTNTFKVKFNPAVFSLYSSGANTQGKKVVHKFIAISIFLFLIVAIFFKVFTSHFGHSKDSNSSKKVGNSFSDHSMIANLDADTFTVVCVGFDCSYLGQTLSLKDLNQYTKDYKLIETKTTNSGYIVFHNYVRNDKFLKGVFNVSFDSSHSN